MARSAALEELKARPQWVAWGWQTRNDKPTKVPLDIMHGGNASSTDSSTWTTFQNAAKVYKKFGGQIGFVVSADDPYCGIDLDHVYTPGGLPDPAAQAIVDSFDSYTEITPSGEGLRIWIKAKLPGTRRRTGNIELYDQDRYFTVTGDHLGGTPDTIEDRQVEMDLWYNELFPSESREPTVALGQKQLIGSKALGLTDYQVCDAAARASNGAGIIQLLRGDTTGYSSQSEADLALMSKLAFYTQDEGQLDRIFRGSGLMREKWEREDYRSVTLAKALDGLGDTYTAPMPLVSHTLSEPRSEAPERDKDEGRSLTALMQADLGEMSWAVWPILPEGVTILAGPPKVGKSWMTMDFALSVALGRTIFDRYQAAQGDVYWLALEDGDRRIQTRLKELGMTTAPDNIWFETSFETVDEGGVDRLARWLSKHSAARLVIIDTLQMWRPTQTGRNAYAEDYNAIKAVRSLAAQYHVTVMIVHHVRKPDADDPLASISGTFGLTGSADGSLILRRKRGSMVGTLEAIGRDVDDLKLAMQFQGHVWTATGVLDSDDDLRHLSDQREEAKDAMQRYGGPVGPKLLAELLQVSEGQAIMELRRMVESGLVEKLGRGSYILSTNLTIPGVR